MGENFRIALGSPRTGLFGALTGRAAATASAPHVQLLRGRVAVAALRPLLVELSSRTGQAGAMDALDFFLGSPTALEKIPYLLLVGLQEGVRPETARADDLDGAVLIYEYKVAGSGTGVFATDDVTGVRTVIAPEDIRTEVAELACRRLLELGAAMALVSFEGETLADRRPAQWSGTPCRMATRQRMVPTYLPLAGTLDATLATLEIGRAHV